MRPILLARHDDPRRREMDGGGACSGGWLPPSIWSRMKASVRPGTPHQSLLPTEFPRIGAPQAACGNR